MIKNLLSSQSKAAKCFADFRFLFLLLIAFFTSFGLKGQITVTSTGGTSPSTYGTLNAAFTAINAGTHTGVIAISITADTTEPATPVALLKSASPSNYTSITIKPTGNRVINSAATPTASRGIIEFLGADNITIDGDDPSTSGARNLTIQSVTSTNAGVAVIRVASNSTTGADGANNITVKNCNITGSRSSATSTVVNYGIVMSDATITTGAYSSLNTIIQNNVITRAYHGIYANGASATYPNTGLQILNNTIGTPASGTFADATTIGFRGIYLAYTAAVAGGAIVRGNDIRVGVNLTGYTATIAAIEVGTVNYAIVIDKNNIHDISQPESTGYGAYGIYVTGSTNNSLSTISNNFIRDLKMVAYNSSSTSLFTVAGLYLTAGAQGINFSNNTIIIGTQLAAGNWFSACVNSSVSGVRFDKFLNNILVNTHTSTSAFGLYTNSNANISSGAVNNNDYYVPNTGNIGYYTSNRATLSAWQTATSKDAASKNVLPNFISATDLHLNTSGNTDLESTGISSATTGVTDDIDGDARGTTPDIGADEITIVTGANDAGISAVATAAITCPGTQNVSVTLKNFGTSALTSATINWSVNGVAQTPYSWTGSLATNATANVVIGTYNFLSVVSYTIVASTASPNATTDANTANDSFTTTAFQTGLSGTYTVGTGGNFTNLTAASTYINTNNICGPTTFSLTGTYSSSGETFPITINALTGLSAVNTLTIKPATGATPTISGSSSGSSIIKLNGADYVTIDGSNTVGGTSKDLTITNTSTAASSSAAIWLSSLGASAGATNNVIKNTNLATGSLSNIGYGVTLGGSTVGSAGADNDNNTIQNNTITVASNAIDAVGTAANVNDNLVISNNTVSYISGSLVSIGIRVGYGLNGSVTGNTVSASTSIGNSPVGISIETGYTSASITKNKINAITTSSTLGYGSRGITIGTGTATSNLTVANNMIYGVNGSNFSSFGNSSSIGIGIGMIGGSSTLTTTAGGVNLYYNSVNMYGSYTRANVCVTTALYVGSGATVLDIRNNVLVNSMINTDTSSGASKNYAIYSAAANTAFTNINYNDYYVSGTQGVLGFLGSDATTLAAWKTATGKDANSINVDPLFVSNTNLHLNSGTPSAVESAGTVVAITDDIDGDSRGTTPDMGADEISIVVGPNDAGISAIPTSGITCPGTQNVTVTLKNFGTAALTSTTINWSVNGVAQTPYSWTGNLASGATVDVVLGTYNFVGAVSYTTIASTILPNGAADSNSANDSKTSAAFQTSLSGTYTVGTGGNFTTLTAAVAYANTSGICGATLFSLTDALYATSETFPITFNAIAGISATNTLTVKPAIGKTPIIRDNNASAIFVLNGANYITIDGSNATGGTSKDLTIRNNNTTTGSGINFINGSSNNNIKYNNILTAQATTSTLTGAVNFSTSTAAAGNNNNTIQENKISSSASLPVIGVYNLGTAGKLNTNNTVMKNDISDFSYAGIYDAGNSSGFVYDGNKIFGTVTQTSTTSLTGIIMNGTTIFNPIIKNNKIYDLKSSNTSATTPVLTGGYLKGIDVYDIAPSSTCSISNNMISLYGNGAGAPGVRISGIEDESTGGTVNIYYNSVNITGAATSASASFAFLKNYSDTTILKNNIFSNKRTSTGTSAQYAIVWDSSAGGSLTSDYNDFYSSGNTNNILAATTADISTLAAWQTATGKDANSLNVNPPFTAITDLHISGCSSLESAGTPIVGFTTDYDSEARSATTPDIGADEFAGNIPPKVATVTNGSNCGTGTVVLGATGTSTGAAITEYRLYTTSTGGTAVATSSTGTLTTPSISTTTNYYIAAFNGCESETRTLVTATINPAPTDIVLTPTISPVAADECGLDYVKLEAAGGVISGTPTVNSGTVNLAIPDNSLTTGASQTLTVSGIGAGATVSKVEVKLNITHSFDSDLRINLEAPNGKIINLVNQAGGSGANFTNTVVTSDTSAAAFSTGTAPLTGTFKADLATQATVGTTPAVNATVFSDLFTMPNGNWKVRIYDDANLDTGVLVDCSIAITYSSGQQVTWSPATGLYTDTALTIPYVANDFASTVYAAPTTATSYTAKAIQGTCEKVVTTASIQRLKKEFRGPGTDWNTASNWFPAQVPDNGKCASIPATQTVVISSNAEAKSLTIAATGKTTITAGNSLTVTDAINITNNATNENLILESDANLLQTNAVSNTGKMLAKRDVKMRQKDYTYWSSPVKDQPLLNTADVNAPNSTGGFSEGSPNNRIFQYNEADDKFYATPDTKFLDAKGYAIRGKSTYDPVTLTVDTNLKFTGTPNNGNYSINIKKSNNTGTGGTVEHGYNLIGNPYPSNMDFVKFFFLGNNSNIINGKAWFWSNVTPVTKQDGSSYSGNNYATITLLGGTPPTTTVTPSAAAGVYIPTKNIKVGQAFIVQAKNIGINQTLTFDNTIRTNEAGVFYNNKMTSDVNRYWVMLTTPEHIVNTVLIGHVDGATNNYDPNYDADILSIGDDSFYSKLNTQKLQIQARSNPVNVEDIIPLGTKYAANGNYKISLGNKEGIFETNQKIYLYDKLNNLYTDLTAQDYIFAANKGLDETRFEIVYKNKEVLASSDLAKSQFTVYRDGEYFVIKSSQNLGNVELFEASGKLIISKTTSQKELRLDARTIVSGVYIIKADNAGNIRTKKIIK